LYEYRKAMRGKCGPEYEGVVGRWRKPHSEGFNDFFSSPVIMVIKSRRKDNMRGACGTHGR